MTHLIRRAAAAVAAVLASASALQAQDPNAANDAIRIGITYQPGTRPGLVVVPTSGAETAREIIKRDLDYSDRFQLIEAGSGGAGGGGAFNYSYYRTQFGAQHAVEVVPATGGVTVRLHDLATSKVRNQATVALPPEGSAGYRLAVHRAADEVVRWATGSPGYAASRIVYLSGGRLYRIDSDGEDNATLTPGGQSAFSSAWAPDGRRIAYMRLETGSIMLMDLATGATEAVPGTTTGQNYAPAFSPDGRVVAYARSEEGGATNIFSANIAERCCVQRLTVRGFALNLSPSFSPDGRRIAFVSNRAGSSQIYVMGASGTDQELLVPYEYGSSGPSYAPEWSPDGANVVFHREVSRSPQIFLFDVASQRVKQLTSIGRSEDATWAPDGRHIAFVSDRTGRRQLWVVDTETGRVRQLNTAGAARIPSWSRRLGG